jgi:transposase InsO family protein
MGIKAPPEVKFAMIQAATAHDDNLLSISELCRLAEVSRSGYYRWLDGAPVRDMREEQDKADFKQIVEAYNVRGYAKGARSIYMTILHRDIRMNLKKIRRLLNKYGLFCPIRRANPYRRMAKAMRTSTVANNVVDRNFRAYGVRKVLLTDITYLPFKSGRCYLSTILDAYTHEVLAYEISMSLKVDFVLDTVAQLIDKHGSALDSSTIVHSDQGCHYTSIAFIEKLRDAEFVQSMSRRGNCWDNAPQESFFGHMKDEIAYEIAKKDSFPDVKTLVDDWMDYYNNERYQWSLVKLSPCEYYRYATIGFYPLQEYKK